MTMKQVAKGFCQWWAGKAKKAVAVVKRELLIKKIRRSLSIVINMRDALVRHRLEARRGLEHVRLMMDACSCGTSSLEKPLTKKTTLPSIWAVKLDAEILSEHETEEEKEATPTLGEHDHECLHDRDVPSVKKTVELLSLDRKDKMFLAKCKKCTRAIEMVSCFQSSVADYNKTIFTVEKYIRECAREISRLECERKWGRFGA